MKTTPTKRKRKKTKKSGTSRLKAIVFASIFAVTLAGQAAAQTPPPETSSGSSSTSPAITSSGSSSRSIPNGGSSSRSIEGTVLSSNGTPVPGAIVQIKDSKTLQVRSYIAQQNGRYQFWGLSNDVNYQLRAMAGGLTSKNKTVSVFNSRRKIILNLKLTQKFKP
jgi:hypothetical protein